MTENQAREEVCCIGQSLFERGMPIRAAMTTLEELEETAKLWLLAKPKPEPLTAIQIDERRQTFGARW